MFEFIKAHAVRITGLLTALVPVGAWALPDVDWQEVLGAVLVLLGLGEAVQRVEDSKTREALLEEPPELAEVHQLHD
ncbi:hypothetical protein [Streptomyces sp. Tu6071]|uniref:hypothetical protein n=1 Tax=Streptomyces sp. Tu6071 TaxID=355249 RepID=UPI0005B84347|nr:hypothetical protein [Streptomyces sp. Tu6071]